MIILFGRPSVWKVWKTHSNKLTLLPAVSQAVFNPKQKHGTLHNKTTQ